MGRGAGAGRRLRSRCAARSGPRTARPTIAQSGCSRSGGPSADRAADTIPRRRQSAGAADRGDPRSAAQAEPTTPPAPATTPSCSPSTRPSSTSAGRGARIAAGEHGRTVAAVETRALGAWAGLLADGRDGAARRAGVPLAGRRALAGGVRPRSRQGGSDLRRALPRRPWTLWRYRELLPLSNFDGRVDLGEGGRRSSACAAWRRTGIELWVKDEARQPHGLVQGAGPVAGREPGPRAGSSRRAARERRQRRPGAHRLRGGGGPAGAGGPARGHAAGRSSSAAASTAPRCSPRRARWSRRRSCWRTGKEATGRSRPCASPTGWRGRRRWGWSWPSSSAGSCRTGSSIRWAAAPGSWACTRPSPSCERLGLIGPKRPRFVVVQAAGCAPIVRAFERGRRRRPSPGRTRRRGSGGCGCRGRSATSWCSEPCARRAARAIAVDEARLPEIAAWVAAHEGLRVGPEGAAALAAVRGPGGGGGLLAGGAGGGLPDGRSGQLRLSGLAVESDAAFLDGLVAFRNRLPAVGPGGHGRRDPLGGSGRRSPERRAGGDRDPLRLRLPDQAVHRHPRPGARRGRARCPSRTRIGEIWPEAHPELARRPLSDLLRHRSGLAGWTPLYHPLPVVEEERSELLLAAARMRPRAPGRARTATSAIMLWGRRPRGAWDSPWPSCSARGSSSPWVCSRSSRPRGAAGSRAQSYMGTGKEMELAANAGFDRSRSGAAAARTAPGRQRPLSRGARASGRRSRARRPVRRRARPLAARRGMAGSRTSVETGEAWHAALTGRRPVRPGLVAEEPSRTAPGGRSRPPLSVTPVSLATVSGSTRNGRRVFVLLGPGIDPAMRHESLAPALPRRRVSALGQHLKRDDGGSTDGTFVIWSWSTGCAPRWPSTTARLRRHLGDRPGGARGARPVRADRHRARRDRPHGRGQRPPDLARRHLRRPPRGAQGRRAAGGPGADRQPPLRLGHPVGDLRRAARS